MFYIGRIVGRGQINRRELVKILRSAEMEQLCVDVAERMIDDKYNVYYQVTVNRAAGIKGFAPDRVAAEIHVHPQTSAKIRAQLAREKHMAVISGKRFRKEVSERTRYVAVDRFHDKRKNRPKRGA